MPHQIIPIQIQQLRVGFFRITAPGIKACAINHIRRDTRIIEGFYQGVIHQHILAPLFMLQFLNVFNEMLIVFVERPAIHPGLINFSGNQPFTDKNFARRRHIQWSVMHTALGLQR